LVPAAKPKKPQGGGPFAGLGAIPADDGVPDPEQSTAARRRCGPIFPSFLAIANAKIGSSLIV
jgi:hypothetical protein